MRTGLVDEFACDLTVVLLWKRTCTRIERRFNMSTTIKDVAEGILIPGIMIPDSKLTREATELVRDTEPSLLFNHSTRVYCFASLAGKRRELEFDSELLYVAAMFHDMGLTPKYSSKSDRFEVDGANTARAFLRQHNIPELEIDTVWTAIALHTTPGIPQHMHPGLRC
jgi:HD superfamily phosphodiesterase